MVRGEVFHLLAPRGTRGHEQRGARYAVIVQADEFLDLLTTIVAPTSTGAPVDELPAHDHARRAPDTGHCRTDDRRRPSTAGSIRRTARRKRAERGGRGSRSHPRQLVLQG